jgi:hypothetical protein
MLTLARAARGAFLLNGVNKVYLIRFGLVQTFLKVSPLLAHDVSFLKLGLHVNWYHRHIALLFVLPARRGMYVNVIQTAPDLVYMWFSLPC